MARKRQIDEPRDLKIRDIRVMGAQKSDCQKMGAAHFFFFEEPIFSTKKIIGGAPIVRPFFFLRRPFSQKKNMGDVPIEFVLFSAW